jgi:ATP-dependent Lhr-like helicase
MGSSAPETELQTDARLARLLRVTWDPFFGRFGRLTDVQRAAIAPILNGADVLVCAATASGKTEAACAPLIEARHARRSWSILYISPTRALVNDLYERLFPALDHLGMSLVRRTGDHPAVIKDAPAVLLTTPESFDSMLCRARGSDGRHPLAFVDAVVLDEIHLLHGTPRGEQVRWLLTRLRRLREQATRQGHVRDPGVQVVGLSATIPDRVAVREAYLPGGTMVEVAGGREIHHVCVGVDKPSESAIPAYVGQLGKPEKILVFVNKRKRAEDLGTLLRQALESGGYSVRVHHGSLGQQEREAVEEAAKHEERIVIVATSTLEIGIDIGTIDLVVLDEPAPSVSAMLQRLGRGNRRTGVTRVMLCGPTRCDHVVQRAMLAAARDGWLGLPEYGPQHAVARQQLASYVFQSRSRSRPRVQLQQLLDTCGSSVLAPSLLDHLVAAGELLEDDSGLRLGSEWLDASSNAALHSNIESTPSQNVVDRDSGRIVAKGIRFHGGLGLTVGGASHKVYGHSGHVVEVRREGGKDPLVEGKWRFETRGQRFGGGIPAAVRRFLRLEDDEWPVLMSGGRTFVFHLGGDRMKCVLRLVRDVLGRDSGIASVSDWSTVATMTPAVRPQSLERLSAAALHGQIVDSIGTIERACGRPAANRQLPTAARVHEVEGWLRLEESVAALQRSRWVEPSSEVRSYLITSVEGRP